ncbi:ferritin-like domain-containing protein [Rhizobium laguerreae]|uniref:YciE/YciF ferroxidase family protein n=2 Tax=Rhizobium TaxID=379 RepID=UPI0035E3FCEC
MVHRRGQVDALAAVQMHCHLLWLLCLVRACDARFQKPFGLCGTGERILVMQISSFKDMYLAELQELASVEEQLAESLLQMAEVASHPALKDALVHHREQTEIQKERLLSLLQKHRADPTAHTDQAMQALIGETENMMTMLKGNDLRDAGLIASAQRLGHYEIAAYGTAAALAGQLDLRSPRDEGQSNCCARR